MVGAPIIAVLSTGRCGTQWLAAVLNELHPELEVEHEPLGALYQPRRFFRRFADPETILEVPEVARHAARIDRLAQGYVETGWPLFPALPLLAHRFPERLRIVHLTRHPVPSALSHLAHNAYADSPRDDQYTRLATLGPRDPGVVHTEYAAVWDGLTAYEKCLFWWTEVHAFGLELPARLGRIPLLRIASERLLSGERSTLSRLLAFLGLPWREAWLPLTGRRVDRWPHQTREPLDPLRVLDHPATVEVARHLGYDPGAINLADLTSRYHGEPDPRLDRFERRVVR